MTDARTRKVALITHVTCSVGWLGAVAASVVLGVAGIAADGSTTVRSAYVSLELIGWFALVPLGIASLLTGVVQSLITTWGLVRHYWVLAKLIINVIAVAVLLLYMQSLAVLADRARATGLHADAVDLSDPSPMLHGAVALLMLIIATALSVLKPPGLTRRGQHYSNASRAAPVAVDRV
jgi:hypothetical protein